MKKQKEAADRSVTGPMLKSLVDLDRLNAQQMTMTVPVVDSSRLKPAADYQDDGGGYNSNLVFPQE